MNAAKRKGKNFLCDSNPFNYTIFANTATCGWGFPRDQTSTSIS